MWTLHFALLLLHCVCSVCDEQEGIAMIVDISVHFPEYISVNVTYNKQYLLSSAGLSLFSTCRCCCSVLVFTPVDLWGTRRAICRFTVVQTLWCQHNKHMKVRLCLLVTYCIINVIQLAAVICRFPAMLQTIEIILGMLSVTQCAHSVSQERFSTKVTITASFPGQHFDALFCLIPKGRR